MKIKGQLEWMDYLQSTLLNWQPNGFAKFAIFGFLAFASCGLLGSLYLSVAEGLNIEWMIPIILIAGYIALYRYILLPRRVKRIFFQQKDLNAPFEFEITDAGLNLSNELGTNNLPWKTFNKWKENKNLIMLYQSDVMYNILPKRLFSDPQQIEMIKTSLEKNEVPAAKSRYQASWIIFIILFIIAMFFIGWWRGQ